MASWRSGTPIDRLRTQNAALRLEVEYLRSRSAHYRQTLLDILKDPHVQMPEQYREAGWFALGARSA